MRRYAGELAIEILRHAEARRSAQSSATQPLGEPGPSVAREVTAEAAQVLREAARKMRPPKSRLMFNTGSYKDLRLDSGKHATRPLGKAVIKTGPNVGLMRSISRQCVMCAKDATYSCSRCGASLHITLKSCARSGSRTCFDRFHSVQRLEEP